MCKAGQARHIIEASARHHTNVVDTEVMQGRITTSSCHLPELHILALEAGVIVAAVASLSPLLLQKAMVLTSVKVSFGFRNDQRMHNQVELDEIEQLLAETDEDGEEKRIILHLIPDLMRVDSERRRDD